MTFSRKDILRVAAASVVVLVCGAYVWANLPKFMEPLRQFQPRLLPAMLLIPLASILINGLILRTLLRQLHVPVTFKEWYGLTTLSAFGAYLPLPQAGPVVRGIYLKKIHNLSYDKFAATVVVTYVLCLAVMGVVGLLGLGWLLNTGWTAPWQLWGIFGLLAISAAAIRWLAPLLRAFPKLAQFESGLRLLRHTHVVQEVALLQVAMQALTMAGLWLAFLSLGQPLTIGQCLILGVAANGSGIVNVTPGNFGVAEGAAGLAAFWLRLDPHLAVLAYTIYRLVNILVVGLLGPMFIFLLMRRIEPAELPADSHSSVP